MAPRAAAAIGDKATYDKDVKGFVDLAYHDVPRIPLFQPYVNVAMQKNISGYQYWFHRRLDYRSLVKGEHASASPLRRGLNAACMLATIGKRLVTVIPSLIGVVIVTFLLTRVLPGDPAVYFAGPAATPQAIAEIRKQLGLDKPLIVQFGRYVDDLAHGNLGNSLSTGQPVVDRHREPAAGFRRTHAVRASSSPIADRGAARHSRRDEAGLVDRPCLPRGHDRRRVAAGVLHRPAAGLCVLLPARLVAGADRPARRVRHAAAARSPAST